MAKFENPPPPAGGDKGDKGNTPRDGGDKGINFNHVHDGRVEATKPAESNIAALERGIVETAKQLESSIASAAEKFKTLAGLPKDHEFHAENVLKAARGNYENGSPADLQQKKLFDAVRGNIVPSEVANK